MVIKAICDSTGHVTSAEILHGSLSPAEDESLLTRSKQMQFEIKLGMDGLIRRGLDYEGKRNSEAQVFIPYPMRITDQNKDPDVPARPELEKAGLGPWLTIWDELLPDWPLETWWRNVDGGHPLYSYTATVRDSQMVAYGMVSISPNGQWKLHPFYGVDFDNEGRPGLDVDQGFVLYTTKTPNQIFQNVGGTTTSYWSTEWLDNERFVVAAVQEVEITWEHQIVFYHAPELIFGTTSGSRLTVLMGPPVPITHTEKLWQHSDQYERLRYPEFWAKTHQKR